MSRTLQNTRDYVRLSLDTDIEELPDVLLDAWINEGETHVQRLPWLLSDREAEYTFASIANTASYTFASIDATLDEIVGVEAERWALDFRPHLQMVRKYAWSNSTTSEPIEYSVRGRKLFLWAVPNAAFTFIVRGYRKPVITTAAATTFDVPEEFHVLIGEWALARAYEWQDDDIMSALKFQRFEQQVDVISRTYRRTPKGEADTIGYSDSPGWPGRLIYPWE